MNTVRSKDGTLIAFDRAGNGPALILIDGAKVLAPVLTEFFGV